MSKRSFFLVLFIITPFFAYSQCNTLRPQRVIVFDTDQDCAPVTVTQFTITYFFNTPQDPNDIEIRFEWNDPANQISIINIGNGLGVGGGNTEFTATAPLFTYFNNNGQCTIRPTAFILINGVLCPSAEQEQEAFFWGTDEQANGNLFINPVNYDVCFNNPVVNAIFTDNSEFNCNIVAEPDNPNRLQRHVQFVYGTNHNPANTILNLSLEDGGTQVLTTAAGNLALPQTRGTPGLTITAGYFGPIDPIPFPADAPISVSFPMNAPADVSNLVGNDFEITLFNWNICNPYNGNPLSPNYEDAILTTARIVIVDAPSPDFITRRNDAAGLITSVFCLNEDIFFDNETVGGGLDYNWEFFDDNTGITLLNTSSDFNSTFSYSTPGTKLIRLTAANPTAQSPCIEIFERLISISPSLVANIELTDLFNSPLNPEFCQEEGNSLSFDVRLNDNSSGVATPDSRWRWEFYDAQNTLIFEDPPAGGFSTTVLGPYDRIFSTPGTYRAVLRIIDAATTCESMDEESIYVYPAPQANFSVTRVCEGEVTEFQDLSNLTAINGETITDWQWDLDYDGSTFNPNPSYAGQTAFNHSYTSDGSYTAALQVTTDQNACMDIFVQNVVVDPLPLSQISSDVTEGCSMLIVNFTNEFAGAQPDAIAEYIWEIDDGNGFIVDSIQSPLDPDFSNLLPIAFINNTTSDLFFDVRLKVVTVNGCEAMSNLVTIRVFPEPLSGFNSINYSPFDDNCSPITIDFVVDALTQAQSPTDYTWTVADDQGQVSQTSTGAVPAFDFTFTNDLQVIKDYSVTLSSSLGGVCIGDSSVMIRVNPLPFSNFVIDTLEITCDYITLYAEAAQKGLITYNWSLKANGTILFATNTVGDSFQYTVNKVNASTDLEIDLFATNFAGCSSNITSQNISVEPKQNIIVDFSVSPLAQTLPDATIFLENMTNDGPWSYLWDFGDGNTSTDANLKNYTYTQAGTYQVSFTASSGDCVATTVKTITINPIPPIVDFDYDPGSGCSPLHVNFINLTQFALSSSYEWDFGDGSSSNAVNPSHTYFEPGIYSVSLTASNAFNQSNTEIKSQIIEVFETPMVQFDVRPTIVFVPDNPIFTNNQSIGASSFFWDFGDGSTSTESEPTHYYQEEGLFDITLIGSNSFGCADTLMRSGLVEGQQNGRLLVPNAFSPNLSGPTGGDAGASGVNDVFLPLTQGISEFEMFIFNRWGELLFKTKNKEIGWDGYYNGKLCQQDVYVYKLNLVFENGQKTTRTGDVNLIR